MEIPQNESKLRTKILGLNRNVFILGVVSFFNDFSNEMILAAFPAFFTSVLKSGAASLGFVEGVADGVSNILKIYSGRWSDKLQKRRIFILLGYGLSVAIRPFYMLTGSVATVLGLRVTDRIGKGIREAPRDVIISASVEESDMGRSFGYHRAMDQVGGILGPLAAFIILSYYPGGFNVIFSTAFFLGIIAVISIFFVTDIAKARASNGARLLSLSAFRTLPKTFKMYLLAIFLLSVGSLPVAVILLKTISIGLMIATVPLFYMVYSIAYSALSYYAGKVSDRTGIIKVLIFGYVVLLLSYLMIGYAQTTIVLVLAFAVLGISGAATDATQRSFTGHLVSLPVRGTAYGLFNAAIGFGSMFAGIVGGYIWQAYGPSWALIGSGILVVIGMIVLVSSPALKRFD